MSTLRALFDRLLRWTYPHVTHSRTGVLSTFVEVCALLRRQLDQQMIDKFDYQNIFSIWIISRWILNVDISGRFVDPPARATVSNP